MTDERFSLVCLSPQDWDEQLPTNRQQIMLRAAQRGHRVLFIETGNFLGKHIWALLRGPRRASVARRLSRGEAVVPGITVRKALNIAPWAQRFHASGALNARLTAPFLRRATQGLPKPVVLWVYDPCAAHLAGRSGEAFAVYDCVDDYAEQVGADARRRSVVAAADENAAAAARLVFATTQPLFERQRLRNAHTHLAPNGGDFELFAPASSRAYATLELRDLPRPVIGFAGNIAPNKVDLDLLDALARRRPAWTIVVVGPVSREWRDRVDALAAHPNVRLVGPKPYLELPRYVAAFDVGLVPYTSNEYTRSCFPLKVFEYLAAGKPVVASGVPEVAGMEPDVLLCQGVDQFIAGVERALGLGSDTDVARRRALAAENTWERRAQRLLDLVSAELTA
jgi:glycosyltransferase involved in cell wall biosynthesis